MDYTIANENGIEIGMLKEKNYIDIDCGDENSFEIQISSDYYQQIGITEGWRICVPGKEYGGIIDRVKKYTESETVSLSGLTWRGLLTKKIIEPDPGEDYKIVSGEANTIINNLSCVEFDGIFSCTGASGIMINNYHFDRYVDHLAGLEKMLLTKNARLSIAYDSGEPNGAGFVKLSAVTIKDYSNEIEYSDDGTSSFLSFIFEKYSGGINHLICMGKGDLKDRMIIHLYVQEDGSIGNEKYYTGKDERVSTLDYPNAESAAELQKKGVERLKELMSYTSMDMDLYNQELSGLRGVNDDIDIGDVVGGKDFGTGIYLSKQITKKIVTVRNNDETIEYGVGKNTLNRSTATAPVEPEDTYQKQIDGLKGDMSGKLDIAGIDLTDKTLSQVVEFIASKPQRMVFGHLKLPAEAAPDGTGWYKALCALLNAPYRSSDVAGHIILLKGNRTWFGYISGTSEFTVTWTNAAKTVYKNGYYGLAGGSGNDQDWIRTPTHGIIPYQSGGASELGTSTWPFAKLYTVGLWINGNDVTDYVVTQGTSGIWTYRKWDSGIAECWGRSPFSFTGSTLMSTINVSVNIAFPFSFSSKPTIICQSVEQSGYNHIIGNCTYTTSTLQTVSAHCVGDASGTTVGGYLEIYAAGKWN